MSRDVLCQKHRHRGVPKSAETRAKMSSAQRCRTAEHHRKLSEANRGRYYSPDTRAKISVAKLGKPIRRTTCPHCGKVGGANNLSRYHFNNCKHISTGA